MTEMGLFLTNEAAFGAAASAAVSGLAQGLARTACIARALVENGRTVDLSGLDRGAGLLCAKALDLEPGAGRGALSDLFALRDEIDALTKALRRQQPD